MRNRLSCALSLFFLAPLIAEYLLGSLPMSLIVLLPLMAMMYGSAALLIREFARGTGRGWLSIALLAIAYGVFEEGLVTQSLFNPNYLHLRLLDFGYVPALGTGVPWLIFVVSIHAFWSVCTPIGLTESLFPAQRETPWLGWAGRAAFGLLFTVGAVLIGGFSFKQGRFMASPAQLIGAGVAVVILVAIAIALPRRLPSRPGTVPHPIALFLLSFVCGSALQILNHGAQSFLHWSWPVCVAAVLALEVFFLVSLAWFGAGRVWTDLQRFALMAGGLWVYIWAGFGTDISLHGVAGLPAHALIAGAFIALCAFAGWIARSSSSRAPVAPVTLP